MSELTPDYHRIRDIADGCIRGVFTPSEGIKKIGKLLEAQNHIPVEELSSMAPDHKMEQKLTDRLHRIETKIDAIFAEDQVQIPDEVNPGIIPDDILVMAREDSKIAAIQALRARTGMGFAEAKTAVDQALKNENQDA
ncbi:MAG: hypothetical protein JJU29_01920 [Verrucomicrobia bacterium]|nr:hypothetical protein [Verrucomicrobiota bacterium]MCH8510991.1 ribosomal protein L7/L12 [Kiritimatiellia bacterium]